MVAELLFEIGTEEIPSGYLNDAIRQLKELAIRGFEDNRIELGGGVFTYGTPRRLVLIAKAVAESQKDVEEEVLGPPKRVAFDEKGNPTKAALGFAERQVASLEELQTKQTPKGEYVYIKRIQKGQQTIEILKELLPKLVTQISWPKSMRWGNLSFSFARPIHWILAIFGGKVVPFELAGIKSDCFTRGHRFMAPEPMEVLTVEGYFQALERAFVVVDPRERAERVKEGAKKAAQEKGGVPRLDPDLVNTVANLIEYPLALCGAFDEKFLQLPEAVLITAMKEHQKYFAMYDENGNIMPNFVTISNTIPKDNQVVIRGNERVLRARLEDAEFFFNEDRKTPLMDALEELKGVIYQADLGTSYEKVERFSKLAEFLVQKIIPSKRNEVALACQLCKCDLVSHMVGEFPSLQGIMGEIYARMDGHPEEVCSAIREHYMPLRAGGELPEGKIGAVVGMADRMDTVCGCFCVGLEPTGTADPFALRRHALAILRMLEAIEAPVDIEEFIIKALGILRERISFDEGQIFQKIIQFFRERYRQLMLREGYSPELLEAVISVNFRQIDQVRKVLDQLREFSQKTDSFEPLVLTFKRVTNILKNQADRFHVMPSLFQHPCENALWEAFEDAKAKVIRFVEQGEWGKALMVLAGLSKPVEGFFDGVEILTKEDVGLRKNRVGMLQDISELFMKVADFSKFPI